MRVFPGVADAALTARLAAEVDVLRATHGFCLISPISAALYRWQSSFLHKPPAVNMSRVTGRPEHHPQQVHAPWGYGDACDADKLPPALRELADKASRPQNRMRHRLSNKKLGFRSPPGPSPRLFTLLASRHAGGCGVARYPLSVSCMRASQFSVSVTTWPSLIFYFPILSNALPV